MAKRNAERGRVAAKERREHKENRAGFSLSSLSSLRPIGFGVEVARLDGGWRVVFMAFLLSGFGRRMAVLFHGFYPGRSLALSRGG
jgi:hypothetical protein